MNEIKTVPIKYVHPYPNNPRINSESVEKVAASLQSFGWKQPIVVDKDYVIIAGHTRLEAAKYLRMKEVPVLVADDLNEEQVKAYRLADNKTAEFAEWDLEKLGDELAEILDIDMERFGFDLSEFEEEPEVVEDDYEPNLPDEPKAKRGDIYQLGRHRLMCGDATSIDDVETLVDGNAIDMLLTDPPYNVAYEETMEDLAKVGRANKNRASTISNDRMDEGEFRDFLCEAFSNAYMVMKNGAVFHIWYSEREAHNFILACKDAGFVCRQHLVWVKGNATIGRSDFQHMYESVMAGETPETEEDTGHEKSLYGWKEGSRHTWQKKRKEKDVLFFDKPSASALHPTMKPILLFDYEMECNTKKGDSVLDLFAGSGTTIMAAEQNGRTAYCMELDPRYVDTIIDRWEKFTGDKAVRIGESNG